MASIGLTGHVSEIDRFFKQSMPEPNSGCWLWTGTLNNSGDGYGLFRAGGKRTLAHRFSYEKFVGPIPYGLEIDHTCKMSCCVNPEHLEAVTHAVNMRRGTAAKMAGAAQLAKTHCPSGHAYSGDNLYINKGGYRVCRACVRRHALNYMRRKRAEQNAA